jgi:hypothetical protein
MNRDSFEKTDLYVLLLMVVYLEKVGKKFGKYYKNMIEKCM